MRVWIPKRFCPLIHLSKNPMNWLRTRSGPTTIPYLFLLTNLWIWATKTQWTGWIKWSMTLSPWKNAKVRRRLRKCCYNRFLGKDFTHLWTRDYAKFKENDFFFENFLSDDASAKPSTTTLRPSVKSRPYFKKIRQFLANVYNTHYSAFLQLDFS